jgi:hypothetical protein
MDRREGNIDSPRPEYTAELLRHFADLRDGTHGGASSRRDKERLFTAAVALLDPHARQPLHEMKPAVQALSTPAVRRRIYAASSVRLRSWPCADLQNLSDDVVKVSTHLPVLALAKQVGQERFHLPDRHPACLRRALALRSEVDAFCPPVIRIGASLEVTLGD